MACECSTACKAALLSKKTTILGLINALNASGVSDTLISPIYSLMLDEVNRLQQLTRRLDDMQREVASEVATAEEELPKNIVYGISEQLVVIKASSEADYTTISGIFDISLPVPVVPEVPGEGE